MKWHLVLSQCSSYLSEKASSHNRSFIFGLCFWNYQGSHHHFFKEPSYTNHHSSTVGLTSDSVCTSRCEEKEASGFRSEPIWAQPVRLPDLPAETLNNSQMRRGRCMFLTQSSSVQCVLFGYAMKTAFWLFLLSHLCAKCLYIHRFD